MHFSSGILLAFLNLACFIVPSQGSSNGHAQVPIGPSSSKRPNIVFVITDDQDHQMESLAYMPYVKKHLIDEGTLYNRHYCTVALCCPSRVNLWTGRAAHNTNVTDLSPPFGGYPKFVSEGLNDAWLPVWLQKAGYKTYYTGKLMNSHNVQNHNKPFPAGFDGTDFLVEPGTYSYWNPVFQRNKEPPRQYHDVYNTDLVFDSAFDFLDEAVDSKQPFFLAIAPIAPHADLQFLPGGRLKISDPIPAKKHKHLFPDAQVPRTPNFNPDTPQGAAWISELPQQDADNVAYNDEFFRNRLRSLQTVDEKVHELVNRLEAHGILENTYIIYTSDNGYHIGQHRLQPGKSCGYEEDINVPLIIRGPSVARGAITNLVTTHTDLAPTILGLVGEQPRQEFDGAAIPVSATAVGYAETTLEHDEHVNVNFWGHATSEGSFAPARYDNNTYKTLRVIGKGYSLYYSVWCSGEHELYDMQNDPYQTTNIYPTNHVDEPIRIEATWYSKHQIVSRLDALLLVLKRCRAQSCITPWTDLHPEGSVKSLKDALNPKFDEHYARQHKVSFLKCYGGQVLEFEGPLDVRPYVHPQWSEMT